MRFLPNLYATLYLSLFPSQFHFTRWVATQLLQFRDRTFWAFLPLHQMPCPLYASWQLVEIWAARVQIQPLYFAAVWAWEL